MNKSASKWHAFFSPPDEIVHVHWEKHVPFLLIYTRRMQWIVVHCGASVSELYHAWWLCTYCIFAMYICTMHNRMLIQIYASAVRVECLALSLSASLIFPAFAQLFLPHVGSLSLVLVCAVACFPCLAMVSELFSKYVFRIYMFTTSNKYWTIKAHMFPVRS